MASRELNMEDEANRLSTFESRLNPHVQPNDLAACGFFYTDVGNDDTTLCFHCGEDVCEWTSNDYPWVEHALFSPKCSYVLLNKSIGFVDNVFKMRGSPKSKKDLKLLQLPETLKGMIDVRDHADLHSRSARKSEATKGPSNQKAHGSEEPVRSTNESAVSKISSDENTASSDAYGFKRVVGKELAGCKSSKSMASNASMCQKVCLNGSKNVDEKDDTYSRDLTARSEMELCPRKMVSLMIVCAKFAF